MAEFSMVPLGYIHGLASDADLRGKYLRVDTERHTLKKSEYPELWDLFEREGIDYGTTEDTFNLPALAQYAHPSMQLVMRVRP